MAASPPPERLPLGDRHPWPATVPPSPPGDELGPAQLAWLGDAVWELHQRLRHCRHAAAPRELHRAVVAAVNAEAQALALARLEPLLSGPEQDLVRRGRNRAGRGPRGADAATYGRATGFETMLGWLFLRNPRRLAELLDHLEETDLPPVPPNDEPRS